MNKHSQLAKWFRTLLFVLIPTFAICSLLCAYLLVTFEKSIIKNNTELTLSSQKLVDERLRECVYLSSYLSMSAENDELSYKEGAYRKNPAEAYDLSAQLHELVISNEAVSGLFIYYPQSDYIVSNIGCYTSSSYYVLQKFPIRDNYEKWIIDLLSCESNSLISLDFPGGARLCYCRTYTRDAKTVSIIVIQLNPEMISELINSAIYHPDSSAAIISDGAIVLSTGNEDLLSSNLHLSSAPHSSAKINSHFIFKNTSDVLSNVDLVHIYSSNSLLIKFRNVTVVCVVVLSYSLFAALYFALRLSKRNVAPVDNIVNKLVYAEKSDDQNELDFISNQIDKLIYAQSRSDLLLNEYQLHLDDLFINSIMHDQYQSENDISSLAARYGFEFVHPRFQVLIVHLKENIGKNITAYTNELRSISLPGVDIFISCRKNLMIALLNSDEPLSRAELDEINDEMHALSFASMIDGIGISSACESTLLISHCYNEAIEAVKGSCGSSIVGICAYEPVVPDAIEHAVESADEQSSNICVHSSDKKKQTLAGDAKAIVDRNFTDPMMGVYYVSEQLKVNNSYLSTLFKSAHGISMLQYINQLRMDYAKELLMTTELNIKDISLKVGFSSDISFIRAFRRLEGCTPTVYRSTNSSR